MHEFTAQADTNDVLDDAAFPAIAMNEMDKWEFLAEGNADNIGDDRPTPPQFEMVRIIYQKTTAKALAEIAIKLNIVQTGGKRKLLDKILQIWERPHQQSRR
jgi:hypothetical protein